ncbi:CGNR zinc finger domain-containing protein, partial [Phenylobacterium sp.]|uniref:CGNR zinc finger domain-containing protein n=1 Tax=Phenylobacterium sp. TaxID=1871053 RepID=UPI0030F4AD5C
QAVAALARAKVLREAMFSLVAALASGRAPSEAHLACVESHWRAGALARELRVIEGRVVVRPRNDAGGLDLIADVVAHRMVEQVLPAPARRLRLCQGPNCAWTFLDTSKAGRRRWCDMAVCGNTAKARRFQARSATTT